MPTTLIIVVDGELASFRAQAAHSETARIEIVSSRVGTGTLLATCAVGIIASLFLAGGAPGGLSLLMILDPTLHHLEFALMKVTAERPDEEVIDDSYKRGCEQETVNIDHFGGFLFNASA